MHLDPRANITTLLQQALADLKIDSAGITVHLERPRESAHGDFATNLALLLAKTQRANPRAIAQQIVAALPSQEWLAKTEVAGAGFINFYLSPHSKLSLIRDVLAAGDTFGRSTAGGGRTLQIEFVSANPTGPLHVGHGRGAAYGASLSNLLEYVGWDVTREYYVNDAGRQMDILAVSTWLRYLDQQGSHLPFPPNAYQGDYVGDMARQLSAPHGTKFVRPAAAVLAGTPGIPAAGTEESAAAQQREEHLDALIANAKNLLDEDWACIHAHVLTEQLADCRNDLEDFGVNFSVWFSEKSLFDSGMVARCVALLEAQGQVYVHQGAKWFRSTSFGDEKDRVVQRDNGLYTYFASDIAYHLNKFERGFDRIINIWGADHHGYISRVKGAVTALALPTERLEVALVQFAVLYRQGEKASMSTRSGEFVTLRALRKEVGNDACRFFYISRKADQHLDFDLDLATSQSNDNPVYYIQYAHARICSVLAQWEEAGGNEQTLGSAHLYRLENPRELALTGKLSEFPELLLGAATDLAPHQIAFYLKDLAAEFHAWYNAERMLVEDIELRDARVALALSVRQVIRNGMRLLGVSCPTSM